MNKYFRILLLAMLVVVMVSGTAFAGTLTANGGANNATLALEAMGTARNLTLSGTGNNAVSFTSNRSLISGDLINFTFTNVGMAGDTVSICETGNATVMDSTNTTANSTNLNLRANRSVTSGTKMFLVSTSGSGICTASDMGSLALRFQALSSAGVASVSMNITSYGTTIDSANAVNIANYARQYVTTYTSGSSLIDFANNATSNGSKFTGANNTAANAGTASITYTPKDLNTATSGAPNAGLTVSALLSLQDTASWQGVQRVYINGNGVCTLSSNNAVNNAPSGTVNLVLGNAFNGGATFAANVCADVKGNVVLSSRTITGSYDISVGSGGNDPATDTYQTVMSWIPNGYQAIVPYISGSSTYKTICMINNKSSASAGVTVDILSSESGATLSSLSGISVGTVGVQKTMRVDFDSSITPYSYSSGTETAGTATSLTGLQSNDRYSAMINVGASPTQITVNCIQVDPAGSKRAVPVLTQNSGATVWQQ